MLELLAGQNIGVLENEGSVTQATKKKKLIWFTSSHDELWQPQGEQTVASVEGGNQSGQAVKRPKRKRDESDVDRSDQEANSQLFQSLTNEFQVQCSVGSLGDLKKGLSPDTVKVLVLGAPKTLLTQEEIDGIVKFVQDGGGLLVAHSYDSLFEQERQVYEQDQDPPASEEDEKYSTNYLMQEFGLRFKRLLSYPPEDIAQFEPHYMSSDINKIFLREPAYLEILPELPDEVLGSPQVVARLPETQEIFLVGVDVQYGRVAAIADYALFEDDYLGYGSHRQLMLNIVRWLMAENPIDCLEPTMPSEVVKGQAVEFRMTLKNSSQRRLEYVDCLLEGSRGVEIRESRQQIRSIGPFQQTQMQWMVIPHQLGDHQLRLTIELAQRNPLFFDTAAQFECVPDGEVDLVVLDDSGTVPKVLEAGKPYEVVAVLKKTVAVPDSELQVQLQSPSHKIQLEPLKAGMSNRWRLNALGAGTLPITVRVGASERKVSPFLVQVAESVQNRIERIEREALQPLIAQLQYQVSQLDWRFDSEVIRNIPCKIYTPEDQVRLLNSPETAEQKLEALRVARQERRSNRPLIEYLLNQVAPTFSPLHGCCIPYDPELAAELGQRHRNFAEGIAQNLLIAEGEEERLPQNLAALVLHEKYGHGFFFSHTKLGQQLAILYRHGMTRNAEVKRLKAPYPRAMYLRYRKAIQALWDSSVIVNEGFATWLELTVLTQMGGVMAESAYRRRTFLFERDNGLSARAKKSEYFAEFQPFQSSRYRKGCEYLQQIQSWFGKDGIRWAMAAFLKATDIDLGIGESNGQVQFALEPEVLEASLIKVSQNDARADMRLHDIYDLLQDSAEKLRSEQKQLEFGQEHVELDTFIDSLISQTLGW
ncbi:MAG: hypothetical protein B0A82_18970 [Alkalinema sp. CACIAM 70d]|nr:MAG: hypothetical protein B0A82_18970 [Alkalinema sp. CACIAM 70d]